MRIAWPHDPWQSPLQTASSPHFSDARPPMRPPLCRRGAKPECPARLPKRRDHLGCPLRQLRGSFLLGGVQRARRDWPPRPTDRDGHDRGACTAQPADSSPIRPRRGGGLPACQQHSSPAAQAGAQPARALAAPATPQPEVPASHAAMRSAAPASLGATAPPVTCLTACLTLPPYPACQHA
jgi:hypothetical protein